MTREYALEHVQLGYALTVHGIQGETTNTAVVGPDVDAAGLYVGLTRGRHHNIAITVARSDEDAIAQVGEAMMRGTTELTFQDAMPSGLARPSWVMTEQPRTLSRDRITGVAGEVSTDCLAEVRTWLGDFLDL